MSEQVHSSKSQSPPTPVVREVPTVLVLRVPPHSLALEAARVEEIFDADDCARDGGLTSIPLAPPFLKGLLNLGGDPVPLLDLGLLLDLASPAVDPDLASARIALVATGEHRVGLRCAGVLGVVHSEQLRPEQISEPICVRGAGFAELVTAELDCAFGVVPVLDLDRLLDLAQRRALPQR